MHTALLLSITVHVFAHSRQIFESFCKLHNHSRINYRTIHLANSFKNIDTLGNKTNDRVTIESFT